MDSRGNEQTLFFRAEKRNERELLLAVVKQKQDDQRKEGTRYKDVRDIEYRKMDHIKTDEVRDIALENPVVQVAERSAQKAQHGDQQRTISLCCRHACDQNQEQYDQQCGEDHEEVDLPG